MKTVNQAAEELGLTHWRVRQIARALGLKAKRRGSLNVFSPAQVEKMKNRNTKPGPKKEKR